MSIAGGYYRAVERAHECGCDCVQIFTKNNNQWRAKELADEDVERFQEALARLGIGHPIAHDSYLINLASSDAALWKKSVEAFRVELLRAERLGLAYVVAHYFSFFVREVQWLYPFASDPFGFGWDVFGTADWRPDIGVLGAKTIWYAQVTALVIGHVAGLVLAHDKAVELFESPRKAAISQYAMLALMVVYTIAGLWLLSR